MTIDQAKHVIEANYSMKENSLALLMYEDCIFSTDAFWSFYDAIACVTRAFVKNEVLTTQITVAYQKILKELIYHFAPNDVAVMEHLPTNYNEYIERLDYAVLAYLENKTEWLDDEMFDLQRDTSND